MNYESMEAQTGTGMPPPWPSPEVLEMMDKRREAEMRAMPVHISVDEVENGYIINSFNGKQRIATSIEDVLEQVERRLRRND